MQPMLQNIEFKTTNARKLINATEFIYNQALKWKRW